jgi:hypothetical protein
MMMNDTNTAANEIQVGTMVRVVNEIGRYSRVAQIRTGASGIILYVLADGGWFSRNEIEIR